MDFSPIVVGGPCKITDVATVMYTEGNCIIEPRPVFRPIPSAVGGEHDDTLIDLVYSIRFTPMAVWSSGYRGSLCPTAYTNWSVSGARLIGAANRAVTVLGSDGEQFAFTRSCLAKPVDVFAGLGESLWGEAEYEGFIGQGKALTDTDAFYTFTSGVAWSQADYPTTHQEALCTAAWGAVTGWDTVYAENGFKLTHEFKVNPVLQGKITVDRKIKSYRPMVSFTPQGPGTSQILSAFALQGASAGIGTRRSANANDFVVTGSGISVTAKSAALHKGEFNFDNEKNRHGEFGMISALAVPGPRLVLA